MKQTYGFDSRGNLVWAVNGKGDPTRWTFDAAGRMRKKEVALSTGSTIKDFTAALTVEWGFDDNDRLTSHKDDAANTSTWAFDAKDRPTVMTYPDSTTITYTHDANDNVTRVVDAIGNQMDDTFDANNRRTARDVTRASGVIDTTEEDYVFDGLGRLTSASDDDYKVEFTYGVIGLSSQVYEETQSFVGGTAYAKTVTKTYDAVGNKVSELYPSGLDLDYTWNDINRLATVTDGTSTIATYAYIGGRSKTLTYPERHERRLDATRATAARWRGSCTRPRRRPPSWTFSTATMRTTTASTSASGPRAPRARGLRTTRPGA